MLNRWVRTMIGTVERNGHRVGQIIKALLRPVRPTAALTSAAALDAVRPRSELVAENALLRLQILVLARTAPPRPLCSAKTISGRKRVLRAWAPDLIGSSIATVKRQDEPHWSRAYGHTVALTH